MNSSVLSSPSRKKSKRLKLSAKIFKKRIPVYPFLDPYHTYKLFGDIILTNSIWQNKQEAIYPFELFLNFKVIRQIHRRSNGAIFELEDSNETEITSIPFFQTRLKSLGTQTAFELADFLNVYQDYFLNESSPDISALIKIKTNQPILEYIDNLFDENSENLVFARVNKLIGERDYRAVLLAYNSKLMEWVSKEKNILSDGFIHDCLKQAYYTDFESFTVILKMLFNDMTNSSKYGASEGIFKKMIKTIAGKIEIVVYPNTVYFPEERLFIQYWIHKRENHDLKTLEKFQMMAKFDAKIIDKCNYSTKPKEVKFYSSLMSRYYCINQGL